MINAAWVMCDSHQDFSLVWFAYCQWRERALCLGFDPDQVLSIGCIGFLQRFGVLVHVDLSEADLRDLFRLENLQREDSTEI